MLDRSLSHINHNDNVLMKRFNARISKLNKVIEHVVGRQRMVAIYEIERKDKAYFINLTKYNIEFFKHILCAVFFSNM